jgi:hypothetical protein
MAKRIGSLLSVLVGLAVTFAWVVRPAYLNWGATVEEQTRVLPGDEIVPRAMNQETRAITIDSPVETVWPWLAQLGQDRGGFYSFDLLENMVGCRMPTVDLLRLDKQSWALGDKLWMYPPDRAGGVGFATLQAFVPGRAMGFATHMVGTPVGQPEDGSWSFVIDPVDRSTSRLLIRGRGEPRHSLLGAAFDRAIFEPVHFVMERRMMIGLKEVAEGTTRRRAENHAQVVLWTITFALFLASAVLVLLRQRWVPMLAAVAASAVVFQILTLGQPPLAIGMLLTASLLPLVLPSHRPRHPSPGAERSGSLVPAGHAS